MSEDPRFNALRARLYEAESLLTQERASIALLRRELSALEAVGQREPVQLAAAAAAARMETEQLRSENEANRKKVAHALSLLAWHRSRYRQVVDSRAFRALVRLRDWQRRAPVASDSAGTAADAALIDASGRFDRAWYLATYTDVAGAGMDPVEHYLAFGADEGRNPSKDFDTSGYRAAHPDLAPGTNPLLHAILQEEPTV